MASDIKVEVIEENIIIELAPVAAVANGTTGGGTTKQVWGKKSAAAYDSDWIDQEGGGVQTVIAGTNIAVDNTDPLNPIISATGSASGEANTASNSSAGTGSGLIFKLKSGVDLVFKKIKAGTNVSVTNGVDDITVDVDLSGKVDKVAGKGLSTEDYSTVEKSKLNGIASGAEVNVNADWNAGSGDAQILNKPTIPSQYTDAMADSRIVAGITGKQDLLVNQSNIKSINGVSILGSGDMVISGGGGGEANTASNSASGTGTGLIFKVKSGVDLIFKKIKAGSSNLTIVNGTDDITLDVDLSGREPANANIQSHISNVTTNPHAVTKAQVGLTDADNVSILGLMQITKEFTGFVSPELITRTYDSVNRTITLTGTVTAYYRGVLVSAMVSGWVSPAHSVTTGVKYYLTYNGSAFAWSTTAWGFSDMMIAEVIFGATNKYAMNETHGLMQWQSHEEDHEVIGTYLRSGGDISAFVLSSTTAANRRPDVAQALIKDEDNPSTLLALTSKSYTRKFLGTAGAINFALAQAEIVPVLVNNPYYNSFSSPNWGQTLMPANSVMSIWLYAVPVTDDAGSQAYRFMWLQGQWITQAANASAGAINTAIATELARSTSELNLGESSAVSAEYIAIGRIVIDFTTNWTFRSVQKLSGTRVLQLQSPAGNYISSVITDTTLTGDGTAGNPLSIQSALDLKVDKVTGKVLSTNDYTTAEQTKLNGIAAGAEVNVNADWNSSSGDSQILNKPTLPTFTGIAKIGTGTDLPTSGNTEGDVFFKKL
jgi:hypothetical protein